MATLRASSGRSGGRSGRRARVVCFQCHRKKIRCDLEQPGSECSPCAAEGAVCEYRPSGKGQRPSKARKTSSATPLAPQKGLERSSTRQQEPMQAPVDAEINSIRALLGHQSALHSFERSNGSSIRSKPRPASDGFAPGVLNSYMETFFDSCYAWFPVIDPENADGVSSNIKLPLILQHGIASTAGTICTPLLPDISLPREHYERARELFHSERALHALTLLKAAVLLSFCDSPVPESSTDGSFWWIGVGIRLAQDLRLHRSPRDTASKASPGLLRRIWWTLYARERTAALFQGRPCIIDEQYCSTPPPVTEDFPTDRLSQAQIFVHWIQLCRIMGKIQKHMLNARSTGIGIPTSTIATSLTDWLRSIPENIKLSLSTAETTTFERDVHLLHLPYLTMVALVYLNTTGQDAPEISVAAVLAATCTARLLQDFLLRGSVRKLPEDTGWSIAIATTALMHICHIEAFADHALADIRTLLVTLEHMSTIWTSSKIMLAGLRKLMDASQRGAPSKHLTWPEQERNHVVEDSSPFIPGAENASDLLANDGVLWSDFFPFATADTSPLFGAILKEVQATFEPAGLRTDFADLFTTFWDDFIADNPDWLPEIY